jgi:uncharacterized protein (TIGR03083 family)
MTKDHDWRGLMWDEMADLGSLLHELPDDELDSPSLCEGWAVRDVVGHMLLGHTTPMPSMVATLAKYRFAVSKASFVESKELAGGLDPDELRAAWDELVEDRTMKGISKVIRPHEAFVDHIVHQQDIRRPLDRPRTIPTDRLTAALDGAVVVSSPMFAPKKKVAGLALQATDIDWSHGSGPEVRGTGEALLMAAAGRADALADLEGDGLTTIADRIGVPAPA